jgi:hypothetical protein
MVWFEASVSLVRIALLQIVNSTANDQGQFKVCGTCLKEYIDYEATKK